MTPRTLEFYDWEDIEQFICESLGIETSQFRDYEVSIGGEWDCEDLWHVWMTINNDNISNGSYVTVYLDDIDNTMEQISGHGDWVKCLRPVFEKLRDEIGEFPVIYYSW